VWLVDGGLPEPESFGAPGAWALDSILKVRDGAVAVRMKREPPEVED